MHGFTWKVIRISDEDLKVDVEPTAPSLEAIPTWEGEMIPVEYLTATNVGKLRRQIIKNDTTQNAKLSILTRLSPHSIKKVSENLQEHVKSYPLPTHNHILIERFENTIVIHSCLGNKANETLALALSTLLHSEYGIAVNYQVDPYRIALTTPYKIATEVVKKIIGSLTPESLYEIIESTITESNQFVWRHWHIAKRFGIVERKADYFLSKAKTLVKIFKDTVVSFEAKKEMYHEQLDIESLNSVLRLINENKISLKLIEERDDITCSPLAIPILDKIVPHGLLRPALPNESLMEIVKDRIDNSLLKLICIHKGDWEGVKIIKTLPETFRCPQCQASLLAVTHPNDMDISHIIKKKITRRRLKNEEDVKWKQAWKSASLVQIYGKKAVTVLAGRGVGPKAAARILRKPLHTEEELYAEILKAERLFARTRDFWD
jgi:ATP-dependent Lhr-like helicase